MPNKAKIALLSAYTLARAKRYIEAEELILSETEVSKTVEAMDLLARMRAEQGDTVEARRLWQEIQAVHPEHRPSREALRHLGKQPRWQWHSANLLNMAIVAIVALCLGILISSAITFMPKTRILALQWGEIPSAAQLDQLLPYRGKVQSVMLSSAFFGQANRIGNRALLAEFISERLDIPTSSVYIGTSEAPTISVQLLLSHP